MKCPRRKKNVTQVKINEFEIIHEWCNSVAEMQFIYYKKKTKTATKKKKKNNKNIWKER